MNGSDLKIDGCADIEFKIGGLSMRHQFYVVQNINRSFILGRDWLVQNGVRLYYDLGSLRIGKTYVPMVEDIHIASLLRTSRRVTIKPQSTTICRARHKDHANFKNKTVEVNALDQGFINNEPGLMIGSAVAKTKMSRNVPVLLVNNTNKTFKLRRGCVIGRINVIDDQSIETTVNEVLSSDTSSNLLSELDVADKHRTFIEKIVLQNRDLFAQTDSELGHTNTIKMKIDTGNNPPKKMKPYRTPLNKRKIVDNAINEMLDANIIRRSKSPWSFPIVVVDKKDGTKRFCVDFRQLNKITKTNSFPLPLIDDLLDQLGKSKYFTSLDLKSGYWQVLMDEQDKEKTAFVCHKGLFEFNVMPFGLCNAPQIFSELMSIVLQDLDTFALAYLDDILIFSETIEDHEKHIKTVFDRLRQHGLKLKAKKCSFVKDQTEYLGFVIDKNGIKPNPDKVAAIRTLPSPCTVREVRSFIGMCSYYRRFIPNFSKIAEPLVGLTKKYARFKWDNNCQNAFDFLKESLTVVPLLSFPDPNKEYILYTDASDTAIGACLVQESDKTDDENLFPGIKNEKPIYFLSHKLSDTQTRWSTVERECYCIHYALQKLDAYLHNATFRVFSDHKPLKYLLEAPMKNKKVQLWALGIAGYNCQIDYIPGTENTCADLLSRMPLNDTTEQTNGTTDQTKDTSENVDDEPDINENTFQINYINSNAIDPKDYVKYDVGELDIPPKPEVRLTEDVNVEEEQAKDPEIVRIINLLKQGQAKKALSDKHLIIDNLLYYLSNADSDPTLRLYVPAHYRSQVVQQYHDDNGHLGIDKTFDSIRQKYYWPNLYKELYEYVSKCVTCSVRNLKKIKAPVQETDIPPFSMAKLGLDLSGPYPRSLSGNKYIVGFVDLYSGWPEAFAVPDKTAATIAHLLLEEIFPRYSSPLEIITDNGTENENRVVREALEALNICHVKTSYYHPQGNAKVERFHRTLHDVLAKKLEDNLTTWDIHLNQTLAAIRFNINESSSFSPFYLLYNHDPVLPIDNILKPRRKYMGEEPHQIALEEQHKAFVRVHRIMKQSKKRQAKYANRNAVDIDLKVGDPVYYKNNTRQSKLQSKWLPYFRIIKQLSPVTFRIKNQLTNKVTKAHKELLRLAKLDQWELPKNENDRPLRKAAYVVPPDSESDSEDQNVDVNDQTNDKGTIESDIGSSDSNESNKLSVSSGREPMTVGHDSDLSSYSSNDEEDNTPLSKLANKYRKERENSSSEDDIPLWELSKRLKTKDKVNSNAPLDTDSSDQDSAPYMDIDACYKLKRKTRKTRQRDYNRNVKDVLLAISKLL